MPLSLCELNAFLGSPFRLIYDSPAGPATILIAEGEYHETLNVTRVDPLTLLGQLPFSSFRGSTGPFANASWTNRVQVWDNKYIIAGAGMDNADTVVLTVAPNRAGALIGAGPTGAPLQPLLGNRDFKAYNIDFSNRAVR